MASKGTKGKKVAAAPKPAGSKKPLKKSFQSEHAHLFNKDPKDFGIGRDIQPKKDLSRFVKWPRYVRIQRQRAILKKRLKVPPSLAQFQAALEKNAAANVLRLLTNYRPESEVEKKQRRQKSAESEVKGAAKAESKKPNYIKYGLNHITTLIEEKKAKLVVIAHDVEPVELVVWLPALCRRFEVPYVIVKGKSRLGKLVYKKTATALALTDVRKDDQSKLDQIVASARAQFNDNVNIRKAVGGGIMGVKAQHVQKARAEAMRRQIAKKEKATK
jgi:large subunit ribosomal protein L7Ae